MNKKPKGSTNRNISKRNISKRTIPTWATEKRKCIKCGVVTYWGETDCKAKIKAKP